MSAVIPEFVKTANEAAQYGDARTPTYLFADPATRRFPYHTSASCWRSAEALAKTAAGPAREAAELQIRSAAIVYGIDAEVESLLSQTPTTVKYAYSRVTETGGVAQHLPLRNPTEILMAADYVDRYRDELQLKDRQKIAGAILDAAKDQTVAIPDNIRHELLKQAGRGECTTAQLKNAFLVRSVLLAADPEASESLRKTAARITGRVTRETRCKLASALDGIDREHGLLTRYRDGLPRPEDTMFGLTTCTLKRADAEQLRLATGEVFSKQALRAITHDAVRDWLGDELANDVWDITGVDHDVLAKRASEMEPSDAVRFSQCAQACGVAPLS